MPDVALQAASPLPGVAPESWDGFVEAMASVDHAAAKTASGHLGLFLMAPPRLAALGYVRDVRRDGARGLKTYSCKWVAPHTEAGFLADVHKQYRAFEASCVAYASNIGEVPELVVEGEAVTLSGLLAVAHHAGLPGLAKWLKSSNDRKMHPFTTNAFRAANGGF